MDIGINEAAISGRIELMIERNMSINDAGKIKITYSKNILALYNNMLGYNPVK